MFFSSSDSSQKRNLDLLRAVLLIFEANTNPSNFVRIGQNSFVRTLEGGLGMGTPFFTQKAESMSDLEMASILRNRSNFDKRSIAQTLSAAFGETGNSLESKEVLLKIAYDSDIPMNYFNII